MVPGAKQIGVLINAIPGHPIESLRLENVADETVTASTKLGVPEQPSFYVPGWTVLNAGAGYTWSRYRFDLNVNNLANRVFFWDPASRVSVPIYDGIAVRGKIIIKF